MKKGLKIFLIGLGVLVSVILLTVGIVFVLSESKLNKKFEAPALSFQASTDPVVIQRGKHLAEAAAVCVDCHGENLGGKVFFNDPALGLITAPNLTKGKGGVGSQFTDSDFARIIRFGVLPDNRSVLVMPSDDYSHLSDADLVAIISFVRSVPPVDSNLPTSSFKLVGRALVAFGQLPVQVAERIKPELVKPTMPIPGVSQEYGHYLADISGCTSCHGPGLSGGPIPGAPPGWPLAANLTPGGSVGLWSEAQFIQTIRTGANPGGKKLVEEMPVKYYKNLTDDELKAIWLFIKSMPAKEFGKR